MTIQLNGPGVTIDDVVAVARGGEAVELTATALDAMARARAVVDRLDRGRAPVRHLHRLRGVGHRVDSTRSASGTSGCPGALTCGGHGRAG
jgi:histidine ammonia-lyase